MQAAGSPARQKWQKAKIARLQPFLRIQQILQELGVALHQLVAAIQRCARLLAQFLYLVANAFLGARDGVLDCRIDFGDGFVQALQAFSPIVEGYY